MLEICHDKTSPDDPYREADGQFSLKQKNTYWNWCLRILGECGKNVGERTKF